MKLIKIETNAIQHIWPYVEEFVRLPIDKSLGERSVEDILYSLIQGQLDLWICVEEGKGILGVMVTQVVFYPQFKTLCLYLVGSKPHTIDKWCDQTWNNPDNELMQYCKENNIKHIEGYVRSGWLKKLLKHGFKKYRTVVIKEVN